MISILRITGISVLSVLFFLPVGVFAQDSVSQFDIVGLKLGMTIEQAKAQLLKNHPDTQFATGYYVDYSGGFIPTLDGLPPYKSAKIKVPYELRAGFLTHAYDVGGKDVINESKNTLVYHVTGEWFNLKFTPTENGGRLYAIGRTVRLADLAEKTDELQKQFIMKYGKPSSSGFSTDVWMDDVRGRRLSDSSSEFSRCVVGNVLIDQDVRDFNFKGSELGSVDGGWGALSFAPSFAATPNPRYRQCGTQLSVDFYGDFFEETLSDINTTYFEEYGGGKSYLLQKFPPAQPNKADAPKL